MRLFNTIGWRTPWLDRVVRYCCRELDYPADRIVSATFQRAHNVLYQGSFRSDMHRIRSIRVKINPLATYPIRDDWPRSLPAIDLTDPVEVLVLVTAHEVAHLERCDRFVLALKLQGGRDTTCERATERMARRVLEAFRCARPKLLDSWGDPGPGPVPPAMIHRLTCSRCGQARESARAPSKPTQWFCGACFPDRGLVTEFLIYQKVQRVAGAGEGEGGL